MDAQLKNYLGQVASLPHEEQAEILRLLQDLDVATRREQSQTEFLKFVRQMWPAFIAGSHHQIMADAFERVCNGDLKRLKKEKDRQRILDLAKESNHLDIRSGSLIVTMEFVSECWEFIRPLIDELIDRTNTISKGDEHNGPAKSYQFSI